MIQVALILNILMPVTIVAWTIWRARKPGRAKGPIVLLGSVLLTLDVFAFALFANSLGRAERERWGNYFPEGTHALFLIVCTSFISISYLAERALRFLSRSNNRETRN